MSEILSFVNMDGGRGKPIRDKSPALDIVFVNQLGELTVASRSGYVRLYRKAESSNGRNNGATYITITFPDGTWRIKGNRAAMDEIQKLFLNHLLHWVEVTPNADPDRDEQSETLVIYSIKQVVEGQAPAGTKKGASNETGHPK